MKTVIVEDELINSRLIEDYIAKVPELELVGTFQSALEAKRFIEMNEVDLLFLDINLPDFSGISLLKMIKNPPMTVIISAYSEYALEGYELNIVDYLLKPVEISRFISAVDKVLERTKCTAAYVLPEQEKSEIFLKADSRIVKIALENLIWAESFGEYVKIHTTDITVHPLLSLQKLEEMLPDQQFFRIHRSTIVNRGKIDFVEGEYVSIGTEKRKLSRSRRDAFMEWLLE